MLGAVASGVPPAAFVGEAAEPPGSRWAFIAAAAGTPRWSQLLFPPGSLRPPPPPPSSLKSKGFPPKAGCTQTGGGAGGPRRWHGTRWVPAAPVGARSRGGGPIHAPHGRRHGVSQPGLLAGSWNLQLQLC